MTPNEDDALRLKRIRGWIYGRTGDYLAAMNEPPRPGYQPWLSVTVRTRGFFIGRNPNGTPV